MTLGGAPDGGAVFRRAMPSIERAYLRTLREPVGAPLPSSRVDLAARGPKTALGDHVAWGTVPDWIVAVASVGALIAATWAARAALTQVGYARSQSSHAEEQAREASEQTALMRRSQDREQAALVAAWLEFHPIYGLRAMVLNASPAPVYDVTVNFHSHSRHEHEYMAILLPNRSHVDLAGLSASIAEAVGQRPSILEAWVAQSEGVTLAQEKTEAQSPIGLTINFHDGAGRCWTRELNGELTGPDERARLSKY